MYGKVYGEDRAMLRVPVLLCCEGDCVIEVQAYSDVFGRSMVTVMCQVQRSRLGVWSSVL